MNVLVLFYMITDACFHYQEDKKLAWAFVNARDMFLG